MCSIEGCEQVVQARTWCRGHYDRWRRYGHPTEGGPRPYQQKRSGCVIEGCDNKHEALGYCHRHYQKLRRYGDPVFQPEPRGGKRPLDHRGYVVIWRPGHPNAPTGVVAEHRIVMAEKLGRPLRRGENVHHINGVRHDNRPENLELWLKTQPPGQRVADMIRFAQSILEQYGGDPTPYE